MEMMKAVEQLGALAHETRLAVFRLLVRRGDAGLAAGEIATRAEVAPPNASFHLAELVRVGLVTSRRDGRSVIYAIDFSAIAGLVDYLKENCCAEESDQGCGPQEAEPNSLRRSRGGLGGKAGVRPGVAAPHLNNRRKKNGNDRPSKR